MKHAALLLAMSAILGLGVLGVGTTHAQNTQDGVWWPQHGAPGQGDGIIQRSDPYNTWDRSGRGHDHRWHNRRGHDDHGWHNRRNWHRPGIGIYVEPTPRYYTRRTYTRRVGDAHVEWCYDQYRSYRESDNTWQPYRGPRRECISPYS